MGHVLSISPKWLFPFPSSWVVTPAIDLCLDYIYLKILNKFRATDIIYWLSRTDEVFCQNGRDIWIDQRKSSNHLFLQNFLLCLVCVCVFTYTCVCVSLLIVLFKHAFFSCFNHLWIHIYYIGFHMHLYNIFMIHLIIKTLSVSNICQVLHIHWLVQSLNQSFEVDVLFSFYK